MRFLFVGGSIAVVAYALVKDPAQLQARLTPNPETLRDWWLVFLATTAAGFSLGLTDAIRDGNAELHFPNHYEHGSQSSAW